MDGRLTDIAQVFSFDQRFAPGGRVRYLSDWIAPDAADALLAELRESVVWEARTIRLFGREVMQPRLVAFQGDPGVVYRYSGSRWQAGAWHPAIAELRKRLDRELRAAFNSVLLNLYRDGNDSMGWHSDNETELGGGPLIASVSLGAPRRFVLRRRDDHRVRREVTPAHGSVLVMSGDLQRHWQHQVPRTRRTVGARINLTFRRIQGSRNRSRK